MAMKLLLVDDEAPILDVLKATLEPLGSQVLALTDGRQAERQIESHKFDGIIVDVHMPHPDGFELTRQARSSGLNSNVPIVMLTGYDDVETMREGFKAGATCFLGKPITRERIYNLMNALRGPILTQKRRHARLPYKTKVQCQWGAIGDRHFVAESVNVGEGGMLLEPSAGLQTGQEIMLEFAMPTLDRPLRIKGRVLRLEPPQRFAVEFCDGSVRDHEAIQYFVRGRIQEVQS